MKRLYLQVYLGFLAILAASALAAVLLHGWWRGEQIAGGDQVRALGQILADALPAGASGPELESALRGRAAELDVHLALYDAEGGLLARTARGPRLPPPPREPLMRIARRGPPALAIRLEDGRWMTVGFRRTPGAIWHFLGTLALVVALLGIGAYPLARRITRRQERLRARVEHFGAGRLDTRAPIEGKDEIAALATSFNGAADRIQRLLEAERRMLAHASHELRSPLARLRIAVELMGKDAPAALREEAERDVAELDALIDDLLLGARLGSGESTLRIAPVELRALLEEECARVGARAAGPPLVLRGDAKVLRRLLRNLLENARRHGGGSEVDAELAALPGGGVRLRVSDRGPGVPDAERERIFEPFYHRAAADDAPHGGVGLGLALVREIARRHAGTARCLPRPGGGAIFEVELEDLVAPPIGTL